MAISLFHHRMDARGLPVFPRHPHAHHIGFAAAIVGLLAIPAGTYIVPPLIAIGLGAAAILLSLHPAPGLNARPEGWAAIAMGLMGLAFGAADLFVRQML